MDMYGKCFANDIGATGQFALNGVRTTSLPEVLLAGDVQTWATSFTPPKVPNQTNGGAVAGTAAGGAVAGAAVIGIVLFNKKKQLKQAPSVELAPKFATAV